MTDQGKDYLEIVVLPHPFPVSCKGKYYLRSGSTLQTLSGVSLDECMLRKQGVTWDGIPVPYISAEDLSEKAITTFISKAEKKGRLDSDLRQESKEELVRKLMQGLEEQGLIQRIGSRKKGTWKVTTNA